MWKKMVLMAAFFSGLTFGEVAAAENGLRISILGDSYSTFRNWIPKGNAVYYPTPKSKNDVSSVEECWWHIVVKELGAKLEKNDSWSGSTICFTGYYGKDACRSSFVNRVNLLGDPDLILICGGTNDSWANSPVGEYKWEKWNRTDLYSFRPAMAKMLAEIKTLYPGARVIFILNSGLKPAINDSVRKICSYYGVQCVDLKNIDKQSSHPSVKGMKEFARQVIEAINSPAGETQP